MWHSYKIGECYFIRTLSNYYTGRLESITETDLVLSDAAWIPDTGRFFDFLKTGKPTECEPYPDGVAINRGVVVDFSVWPHPLLREQI